MSVSEASKQFGFPEESLQVWTVTKIPINQGRPQRSCNQHSVPPTAKRKHMPYDKASLVNAMQATKDGMSALRASKLHGVPVSTLYDWIRRNGTGSTRRDKGRRIDAMNRRKTPKSSKSTPSSNDTYKRMHYGKAKLLKAVQATKDGMTICKASKLYGVPASTLRDWITQRSRTKKITPPTASQSARNQYDEVNTVDALKAIHEGSTIFKASRQFDVPKSTLHDKIQGIIRIDSTKHQQSSVHKNVKTPKTQYYNEIKLINAFRAIPDGLTVYKTARQCDAPKSALRLTIKKQRGVQTSSLCDQTKHVGSVKNDSTKPMVLKAKRKRSMYDQDKLVRAFKLTQEGTRVCQAARQYGVPDSTLRDMINKQRGVQKSKLCDQTICNVNNDSTKRKQSSNSMVSTSKRKRCTYDQDNLVQAFKLTQEGTCVHQAARQYGVPVSTLRDMFNKQRGVQKPTLCDQTIINVKNDSTKPMMLTYKRKHSTYNRVDLIQAFQSTQEGTSVYHAARKYGVPDSTLRDMIKRNPIEDASRGQTNIFTRD